jgi:hypothetical protein
MTITKNLPFSFFPFKKETREEERKPHRNKF